MPLDLLSGSEAIFAAASDSIVVIVILGVLGANVLCLLVLLALKPVRLGMRRRRRPGSAGASPSLRRPLRACVAEAIGTFALVFVACLAAAQNANLPGSALAQGAIIAAMITALGRFSGGHYNPAVTLGVVAAGRMSPMLGGAYWSAQLGGAVVAALLLVGVGCGHAVSMATPAISTSAATTVTVPAAILLESVATFFLVVVVFGSSLDDRAPRVIHPLAVGLTVGIGVLSIGALTGAALNPARYVGPALVAARWTNWIVYIAGPFLGGSLAAVVMQFFFLDSPAEELARDLDLDHLADSPQRPAA